MSRKKFSSLKERTAKNYKEKDNFGAGKYLITLPEDYEFFNSKKGMHEIEILPYEVTTENDPEVNKGDVNYTLTIWTHNNIGVNRDQYICLAKNYGKHCPICEEYEELKNSGAEEDVYENLKPKKRSIYNVYDHADDKVKIFHTSHFLFEKELLEEAIDDDGEVITFADPDEGKTITFKDTGIQGIGRFKRFRFKDRDEPISDELLDQALSLDSLITVYNYDELKKLFHAIDEKEIDDEEDEDEKPVKKQIKHEDEKPVKKQIKHEDEEDEEDTFEEDEEEQKEEAEKPKRKRECKVKHECPFGHTYGKDADNTDDCPNCDDALWEKCCETQAQGEE